MQLAYFSPEDMAQVFGYLLAGSFAAGFVGALLADVARIGVAMAARGLRMRGARAPFDLRVREKLVRHELVVRVLRARIEREAARGG